MVVGVPNVGKSTLINKYTGSAAAKTADKPGVTRGRQWIRIRKDFELMDTPGILWPKFDDKNVGLEPGGTSRGFYRADKRDSARGDKNAV
jgi:ribosome biogenesis GTPase A